jgi:putative peptide maturation dehydrogenase
MFFDGAKGLCAASALTGEETVLSSADLRVLLRLSFDHWTALEALDDDMSIAEHLADRGLLVTNEDTGLVARDEQLTAEQWERYGAFFHFMNRRRQADLVLTLEDAERLAPLAAHALEVFVAEYGEPPPIFHHRDSQRSFALHVEGRGSALYDTLRRRRTTRTFDDAPVSLADLSALLHYSFGCHGYWQYTSSLSALHKTSPSGGGLHPIEAYPIVLNVDGLPAGTYHYNLERNALDQLYERAPDELRANLVAAACGQQFVATAGVVVLLAARFYRSFWKYRQDARAYAVLLMDAGHLSQTFHLVAGELGLGAFVTAAFDGPATDALIDTDGVGESAIALCGCGRAARDRSVLDPDPLPYVARA